MNISFILESFGRGGKERRCVQLIQGLNAQGYKDIQVIIIDGDIAYPELYDTSANIIILDRKRRELSWWQTFREIKKYINEFKPDIVQAWGILSMSFISPIRLTHKFAFICANVADCIKHPRFSYNNIICRISYMIADAIIGNSEKGLRIYNAPKKKSVCIYNGFNENRLTFTEGVDYEALKKDLCIETRYLVTMFARIDYYKDHDAFVALANKVLSTRDDVTFLAVGKGLYYEKYKDIIGPKNRLRFVGFRSDVEPLMFLTNVSVLFTNYKFCEEGLSNSIMESMAVGTPVIATDGGGSPEIIKHGVNGYLVSKNNIEESSRILCHLLDNPAELEQIGQNAKMTVQKRFLLNTMVDQYLALYNNLISK